MTRDELDRLAVGFAVCVPVYEYDEVLERARMLVSLSYRAGMLAAAEMCSKEAARYACAYASSHGSEDDVAATMAHALATDIRRAAEGKG